eukprot:4903945-Pleurochrysis_carterae.AAC.1
MTSGVRQMGACRLCRNIGDARAPRDTVRRTSSLDCASSRALLTATSGRPITCSRSRTGGGPPSAAVSLLKKRDTEK